MNVRPGTVTDDVAKCVDQIIEFVGKDITFAMTLALGKPILLANEIYKRAKEDPSIKLRILTALPLEKPKGHTDLERRFLKPIADRVFDGVPEFDFMLDYSEGKLPPNVETYEFFSKAGRYLHDPIAQQHHIASNYTHIVRDAMDFGVNVFGQLISVKEINGQTMYSMACNTDICIETIRQMNEQRVSGRKVAIVAEANRNMPFMYGDAVVDASKYDIILQGPTFDYRLFCPPKDPVAIADHMIGINVSTLVRDGGTIQVGIGALGDAIVAGLIMRNDHNDIYRQFLEKAGIMSRYQPLIEKWGGTEEFDEGLYGSSEMFVDAFMRMYKSGILKRKVYDSVPLMQLINQKYLKQDNIPPDIIDRLIEMKAIHSVLNQEDFDFLTEFGILKSGLNFAEGQISDGQTRMSADLNSPENRQAIRKVLGTQLRKGHVVLGAFFVGPQAFYDALNEMSEEERQLFEMSGVEKVNQLYGGEELRTLQRKDGRFVNTGMVASLLGSVASDQLEDGRVISGIGGQYNFVAMAHALDDARLIIMIKSTKGSGKTLKSNIVFKYGHCSVPKHLRDIIVTEYGIADVRGKPDKDVIAAMIKIADSRFQDKLIAEAKEAGKLPQSFVLEEQYRHNTPEYLASLVKPYQADGYFKPFPFGTDLTDDDVALGGSLKVLKAMAMGSRGRLISGIAKELFRPIPDSAARHIKRMRLEHPDSIKERIMRKMVVFALRANNRL